MWLTGAPTRLFRSVPSVPPTHTLHHEDNDAVSTQTISRVLHIMNCWSLGLSQQKSGRGVCLVDVVASGSVLPIPETTKIPTMTMTRPRREPMMKTSGSIIMNWAAQIHRADTRQSIIHGKRRQAEDEAEDCPIRESGRHCNPCINIVGIYTRHMPLRRILWMAGGLCGDGITTGTTCGDPATPARASNECHALCWHWQAYRSERSP